MKDVKFATPAREQKELSIPDLKPLTIQGPYDFMSISLFIPTLFFFREMLAPFFGSIKS